jgi:hypothetical protein
MMPSNAREPPEPLEWRVHLASREPAKTMAVFAAAVVASAIGFLLLSWLGFLVGLGLVLGSTSEFLLPIHYRLSETGARARWGLSVSEIAWKDVKQTRSDALGIKISPLSGKSRLEAFRGVYLRFAGNRQEVEAAVRYWFGNHEPLG